MKKNMQDIKRPEKPKKDRLYAEDWNELVKRVKDMDKRLKKLEK